MRTDEYYRIAARISLNGSIAALFPALIIVIGNLIYLHHQQIMLLTIPFFIYSLFCYQGYLGHIKRAIWIKKSVMETKSKYHSLFEASHLLLFFVNTFSPRLMIFYPDGNLAAVMRKNREKGRKTPGFNKTIAIYDCSGNVIGNYLVKGKKHLQIEVYDQNSAYLGCLEKSQLQTMKKSKKELLNAEGRFVGVVQGASSYMDEQIIDPETRPIARLRRGWMPLEWEASFPDPNTPVLSFSKRQTNKGKILQMSFLINEFFLDR